MPKLSLIIFEEERTSFLVKRSNVFRYFKTIKFKIIEIIQTETAHRKTNHSTFFILHIIILSVLFFIENPDHAISPFGYILYEELHIITIILPCRTFNEKIY